MQYNTLLQILKALIQEYMLFKRKIGKYGTKLELNLYICHPYWSKGLGVAGRGLPMLAVADGGER